VGTIGVGVGKFLRRNHAYCSVIEQIPWVLVSAGTIGVGVGKFLRRNHAYLSGKQFPLSLGRGPYKTKNIPKQINSGSFLFSSLMLCIDKSVVTTFALRRGK
jgi:hypothetical protein